MLLAPFSASGCQLEPVTRHRSSVHTPARVRTLPQPSVSYVGWLLLWTLCGALGWSALAMLHGYPGHSVSFWLLGAPLIDLAWLLLRRVTATTKHRRARQ